MFQRIWLGLVDLLAPPGCAACDAPLAQRDLGFCPGCTELIDEAGPDPLGNHEACCLYGGPLADAVVRFKYSGRTDLAAVLASRMVSRAQRCLAGRVDVVTCVPLHRARLHQRGFNQSALLARPVARALGVRFCPGLVLRTRPGLAQAGLGRAERLRNLTGAFAVKGAVAGQRVLVIDDVVTTRSTLSAVASALREAGALQVLSLVLARAEVPAAGDGGGQA